MNKLAMAAGVISVFALVACNEKSGSEIESEVSLDTLEQKVAYTIGVSIAQNTRIDKFEFDQAAFNLAIEDVKSGAEARLSDEEMRATMQAFQTMQREMMAKERQEAAVKNLAEGQAFLKSNAEQEGVEETDSGLQYKVITAGTGPIPAPEDQVLVHYRGTLLDGTEFDSSYKRNQPATFGVTRLIPGWVEALQLMPAGSKWELFIPSNLAYGESGNPSIPPNSVLKFELELLEIVARENDEDEQTEPTGE